MQLTRRQGLAGLLLVTALLAATVLAKVIWSVFFAVTVAYMLVPLHTWLKSRGLPSQVSSVVTSLLATTAILLIFGMAGFLVYRRRQPLIDFITTFPNSIEISALGMTYALETEQTLRTGLSVLTGYAVEMATGLPTLSLKLTVFVFVLFGLLTAHEQVEDAILTAIPGEYHDVAHAFGDRIARTLYAIYVLQVATGVGTFLLALPVFYGLGYDIPVALAFIAGVLQFLPIVGPSILIAGLSIYQAIIGDVVGAVAVLLIGSFVIAFLPDILIRPRLADYTGRLPGTLYFVGFVGGLLTVGAIGVIAGPLAVGLLVEAISLLGAEEA